MPDVSIMIRTLFDERGANEAVKQLTAITNAAKTGMAGQLDPLLSTDIDEIFASSESIEEAQQALQRMAGQYLEVAESAMAAGKSAEVFQAANDARKFQSAAKSLDALTKSQRAVAESGTQIARADSARMFRLLSSAAKGVPTDLKGVQAEMKNLGLSMEDVILQNMQFSGSAVNVRAQLAQMATNARATAQRLLEMGKAQDAARMLRFAQQIDGLSTSFSVLEDKSGGLIGGFRRISDAVNRFGFSLFLITQNIKTVQMLVSGFYNTLLDGAKKADIAVAFNKNLASTGENVADYSDKLRQAAGGLVSFSIAQEATNKAVRSGVPGLAEAIPTLLNIAKGAAEAQGDLSKTEEFFNMLVDAIIKGQPDMLKNVGIFESSEEAARKYRASIGELEQRTLTAEEQQRALFDSVITAGRGLAASGEEVDSYAASLIEMNTVLKESTDSFKLLIGIIGSEAASNILEPLIGVGDVGVIIRATFASIAVAAKITFMEIAEVTTSASAALISYGEVLKAIADRDWEAFKVAASAASAASAEAHDEFLGFFGELDAGLRNSENFTEAIREMGEAFGLVTAEASNTGSGIANFIANARELAAGAFADHILAGLERITGEEAKLIRDLDKAHDDYRERREQIEEDLTDRLAEIAERRDERLAEIEKRREKRLDDINEDLADDLADLDKDTNKKREDATEDFHDKMEDIEEDHQKRLRDIMRKFELARLSALIDRDARALFEAERRRDEELAAEEENYQDKKQDAEERHREEMEDIREREEDKRQELIEQAEKRRQDAIEQAEEQAEEAREQYEKQKEDALEAAQERREDLLESYVERRQDLVDHYREEMLIQDAKELERKIKMDRSLGVLGNTINTHLNQYKTLWQNYFAFLDGYSDFDYPGGPPSPDGGGGTPPGGGGDMGSSDPSPPNCSSRTQTGGFCGTPYGRTFTCPNGTTWTCVGGTWRRVNSSQPQQQQPGNVSGIGGASPFANAVVPTTTGNGQGIRVVLQTTDQTLQAILNEVVGDAFLQIIGDDDAV